MTGRKTLKQIREELEAAVSGKVLTSTATSGRCEVVESLNRFLKSATSSEPVVPTPTKPK